MNLGLRVEVCKSFAHPPSLVSSNAFWLAVKYTELELVESVRSLCTTCRRRLNRELRRRWPLQALETKNDGLVAINRHDEGRTFRLTFHQGSTVARCPAGHPAAQPPQRAERPRSSAPGPAGSAAPAAGLGKDRGGRPPPLP